MNEYFFGQPNSIDRAPTHKLQCYGAGLFVTGALTIVAGAAATVFEAEKTFQMESYTNTHWITTIFIFAGLSALLVDKTKINGFLLLTIGLCLVSLCTGVTTFFADAVNLWVVCSTAQITGKVGSPFGLKSSQVFAMAVYSAVDLMFCVMAIIFSSLILLSVRNISSRFYANVPTYKSMLLFSLGIVLIILAFLKTCLWLEEIFWLRGLGSDAKYLFLHYTIDEPVWGSINYMIGALLLMMTTKGSRLLMYITLALASLSAYPTLTYLWIDYRMMSYVQMNEHSSAMPKQDNILLLSLIVGALHLLFLLITVIVQVSLITRAGTQTFKLTMNIDLKFRQMTVYSGMMLILAGAVLTMTDAANITAKTFYRVFYPTEQKLPFALFVSGPLTILALHKRLGLYFMPIAFPMLVFTAHTSVFMIVAYLFLSHNVYFSEQLCELFHYNRRNCKTELEVLGSWSHFIEADLSACVCMLAVYVAFAIGRLMKFYTINLGELSTEEQNKKRICELWLKILGWVFLVLGIIVFFCSMLITSDVFSADHPLLVLHSTVYRSCLSLSLIVYPIIQICTAKDILYYPLRSTTLIVIGLFRSVDILINLDYRNVGQNTGIAWSLFSLVEIHSLFFFFTTICICIVLIDMSVNRLPRFEFDTQESVNEMEGEVDHAEASTSNGVLDEVLENLGLDQATVPREKPEKFTGDYNEMKDMQPTGQGSTMNLIDSSQD